jgi:hypothetical protein
MPGYSTDVFVAEVDDELKCSICTEVLRDPHGEHSCSAAATKDFIPAIQLALPKLRNGAASETAHEEF